MSLFDKVFAKASDPKSILEAAEKRVAECERLYGSASAIDRKELDEIGSLTTEYNNLSLRISNDRADGKDTSALEREADKLESKLTALKTKNARSNKATSIADDNRTTSRRALDAARKTYVKHRYLELIGEGLIAMGPGVTKLGEALEFWTEHQSDFGVSRLQELAIPSLSRPNGTYFSTLAAWQSETNAPTRDEANAARKIPRGHRSVRFIEPTGVSGNPIRAIGAYSVGEVAAFPAIDSKRYVEGGWAVYADDGQHSDAPEAKAPTQGVELVAKPRKGATPSAGTVRFLKSPASDPIFASLPYSMGDRAVIEDRNTAAELIRRGIAEEVAA
jgi:hypothetical protein